MKKLFLAAIAALFLATGTAIASFPGHAHAGGAGYRLPAYDKMSASEKACADEYIGDDHPTEQEVDGYEQCVKRRNNPLAYVTVTLKQAREQCEADHLDHPTSKAERQQELRNIEDCVKEKTRLSARVTVEAEDEPAWYFEKWECSARMSGVVTLKDIPTIMENIRNLKRHCAWLQCLDDRAAGKVKHCYANDRRWR
jgi:hypothetical protein